MAAVSEDFEGYAVGTELTTDNSIFTGLNSVAPGSPPPRIFGSPARGSRSLSSYLANPDYPPEAFGSTPGSGSINSSNAVRYSVGPLPGAHPEMDYLTSVSAWFYVGFLNVNNYPVTAITEPQQINLVNLPLTLRMTRNDKADPFRLYVSSGPDDVVLSQIVPQDTWFHVEVFSDGVGPLQVRFDGSVVFTGSFNTGQWNTATLNVQYQKWWYKRLVAGPDGSTTVASYGEWHVYVDDLTYAQGAAEVFTQVQPLRRFQRPGKQAVGGVPRLLHDNTRTGSLRRGSSGIV